MKGLRSILMTTAACFIALGCTRENFDRSSAENGGGEKIFLALAAADENVPERTKSVDVDVDEGLSAGYSVRDFVLLQFDENGNRLGSPQYYEYPQDNASGQTVSVLLPKEDGIEYTAVVLANTHSETSVSLFADATTLDKLMQEYQAFQKETDSYRANPDAGYDLLMNGYTTFTKSSDRLDVTLYRNVAKFTVRIENPATSGITFRTAQIKSVPTKIDYFYHLIEDRAPELLAVTYPKRSLFTTFDYEFESFNVSPGESKTLTYYLPAHLMGTSAASTESQKSVMAPDYATFIELYGVSMDGTKFMRYRFYPGENLVNDYNIRPNYHYTLPLKFTTMGNPASDARIEAVSAVLEEPEANSYIVNPLMDDFQQLYCIPVANRVNTFWVNEANLGHVQNATGKTITADNEWSAEIIWQTSSQQLIEFYEFDNATNQFNITANDGRVSPVYKGNVSLNFKPKKGAEGNVLVGVYRTDATGEREYLWSWHLWITDYNPDECRNQNWDGRWKYALPSGQGEVHRYKGSAWDGENAKYHNKWVMDRNLGSMSAEGSLNAIEGLYYPWGRKDPYTYREAYTYNKTDDSFKRFGYDMINGINEQHTLAYSVSHPMRFPRAGSYNPSIYGDPYAENNWRDPDWSVSAQGGATKKSFFDPCPPGWMIPEIDAWDYYNTGGVRDAVQHAVYNYSLYGGTKYFFDGVDDGENYTIYHDGIGGGGYYGRMGGMCIATSAPNYLHLGNNQTFLVRSGTMTSDGMTVRPVQE